MFIMLLSRRSIGSLALLILIFDTNDVGGGGIYSCLHVCLQINSSSDRFCIWAWFIQKFISSLGCPGCPAPSIELDRLRVGGIYSYLVADQHVKQLSCTCGMIHPKIHLISPGCPGCQRAWPGSSVALNAGHFICFSSTFRWRWTGVWYTFPGWPRMTSLPFLRISSTSRTGSSSTNWWVFWSIKAITSTSSSYKWTVRFPYINHFPQSRSLQ